MMGSLQFYYRKRIRRNKGINLNQLLPHELVSDILSRLPLTSLPQVKLTCKLWNSLVVDDPSFPSKHLSHALNNPGHLYTLIDHPNFYFAQKQLDTTVAISLPRQVENNDLGEDKLYHCKDGWVYEREYASCHGLVCHCLVRGQSIHVFNPIIREHVQLPDRPLLGTLRWGFGFAPITHKYKCYCYSTTKLDDKTRLFSSAIYTLGDGDSWREICSPPYPKTVAYKHVYSKGALYWPIHNEDINYLFPEVNTQERGIFDVLSLDLETEKFRQRQFDVPHGTQFIYLAVVGETVAAGAHFSNKLEIFFLIDEDKDIWEAKYTIPFTIPSRILAEPFCFYALDLMGLWMNQELYFSERVINSTYRPVYDVKCFFLGPDDNKLSAFCFPFPKDVHAKITPQLILSHVGSLVSPIKIMKAGKQQLTNLC